MASSEDSTNTTSEQHDTDARIDDISKTDSHAISRTASIRTGCVAERILQLQAKLSPKRDDLNTSPTTNKSPASPTASVLARYSVSKHLLTPRSIPLPETPAKLEMKHIHAIKTPSLAQKWTSKIASPSKVGELDATTSATTSINESEDAKRSGSESEKGQTIGKHLYNQEIHGQHEELYDRNSNQHLQSSLPITPIGEGILAEGIPSGSPSSLRKNSRLPAIDTQYNKAEDPSSTLRRFKYDVAMKSPGSNLAGTHEVRRKSLGTSPGSAYSKILPFILSPSVTSYIPKRQSQNDDLGEEVSPARLGKMDSTEFTVPVTPGSPSLSPSPRQRDQRSLRRRTFYSKSEDMLQKDTDEADNEKQDLPLASSTMALEDVFTNPARPATPYHPDNPQVAGNETLTSPPSLHDIHNPSYIPSVMPRRMGPRPMLQNRHERSISALNVQKQRLNTLATKQATDNPAKLMQTNDLVPEPKKDANLETISKTAIRDNHDSYDYSPLQRASTPRVDQRASIEEAHLAKDDKPVQAQEPQDLTTYILTGDGPSSSYGSDYYTTSRRKFTSLAGSSSPCTSGSRIPRPISSSELELGTVRILSARIENTISDENTPGKLGRELKVVLTINQGIQDVIKIEVHPSTKPSNLQNDHHKENREDQKSSS